MLNCQPLKCRLASLDELESGELGQLEDGGSVVGQDDPLDAAVQHLDKLFRPEGTKNSRYWE